MVTGGWSGSSNTESISSFLDSTEIFSDNIWRIVVDKLPFPMIGLGVQTINNKVLYSGNSFFVIF